MRLFAYDGRLATVLVGTFRFFVVSSLVLVCAMPSLAFIALVGWQPTHFALWVGVAALSPLWPGVHAALSCMSEFARTSGQPGPLFRRFWIAWAAGVGKLWWWWTGVQVLLLVLGYDFALFGDADLVLIGVVVCGALITALSISLSLSVLSDPETRPITRVTAVAARLARRPWIALTWILIVVACVSAILIPVIGPSLAFFVPAGGAWTVVIVDWRFSPARLGDGSTR